MEARVNRAIEQLRGRKLAALKKQYREVFREDPIKVRAYQRRIP